MSANLKSKRKLLKEINQLKINRMKIFYYKIKFNNKI